MTQRTCLIVFQTYHTAEPCRSTYAQLAPYNMRKSPLFTKHFVRLISEHDLFFELTFFPGGHLSPITEQFPVDISHGRPLQLQSLVHITPKYPFVHFEPMHLQVENTEDAQQCSRISECYNYYTSSTSVEK